MRYTILATIVAAPIITITVLFGSPNAGADPTDNAIGNNPGLQQACVFNPAFAHKHKAACAGFDVETVASNGAPNSSYTPPEG